MLVCIMVIIVTNTVITVDESAMDTTVYMHLVEAVAVDVAVVAVVTSHATSARGKVICHTITTQRRPRTNKSKSK